MLEKRKAEVLSAYQQMNQCGLVLGNRGSVSSVDRRTGLIILKTPRDLLVADLQGNILEGDKASSSDLTSHISIYQLFPNVGGIVHPHARFATVFAQVGMDIPVLGSFHRECFCREIPCVNEVAEIANTFREHTIDPQRTPAALVVSHGTYVWGDTATDAVNHAIALEEVAVMAYRTMQLDPGIRAIP